LQDTLAMLDHQKSAAALATELDEVEEEEDEELVSSQLSDLNI